MEALIFRPKIFTSDGKRFKLKSQESQSSWRSGGKGRLSGKMTVSLGVVHRVPLDLHTIPMIVLFDWNVPHLAFILIIGFSRVVVFISVIICMHLNPCTSSSVTSYDWAFSMLPPSLVIFYTLG